MYLSEVPGLHRACTAVVHVISYMSSGLLIDTLSDDDALPQVLGIEQYDIAHDRGSSHGESRIIRLAYHEHPDYVPLLLRAYQLWQELERESGQATHNLGHLHSVTNLSIFFFHKPLAWSGR